MSNIKVSIIVPVYNTEKYLSRCLDSLVKQTLKEIEVICINDKSPDNSITILREYEQKYPEIIKVIDSHINLRQGGARNLGIKASQGDYIGFVDSDDWVELEMFEELYENRAGVDGEIIYCGYQTALSVSGPYYPVERKLMIDWNSDLQTIKRNLIVSPSSIVTGLYSRNLFFDNNILFPEKTFYEDNYIVPLLVAHSNSIKKVDNNLYYYYKGNVSTTRDFNNLNFFDRVKTAKMFFEETKKRNFKELQEEIEFYFIEIFLINTSIGCLRKFYPIRFKELMSYRREIVKYIPNYQNNSYLKKKMKKNIQYKVYTKLLYYAPQILYLIFWPYSVVKKIKFITK